MGSSHRLEPIFVRGKISFRVWKGEEVAVAVSADRRWNPGQPLQEPLLPELRGGAAA